MEDFNSFLNYLTSKNSNDITINDFKYFDNTFTLIVNDEEYHKINHNDIVIMNHKTKKYRTFKFIEKTNSNIKFKCNNLNLIIFPVSMH